MIVDAAGSIALANEEANRMLANGRESLIGRALDSIVPLGSRQALLEVAAQPAEAVDTATAPSRRLRTMAVRLDGTSVEVEVTLGAARTGGGSKPIMVVSLRAVEPSPTVGEPDEIWRYFDVAVKLSDRLGSVSNEEEALASILPVMLPSLGWDVACLWSVGTDGKRLICADTWPNDSGPTQPFEDVSRNTRPRVGEGLPGSAWGSGRPLMSSVGIGEMRLLRQDAIRVSGLQTGVAFPLVADGGVVGVIEMFTRRSYSVSLRVLEGLAGIGRQIGQVLDHVRGETRRREEERLASFLLEATTVLSEATSYADALERLATISVPELADLCLIDVKQDDGTIARMAAAHADPSKANLVSRLETEYPPVAGSEHPSSDVIATGVSRWSSHMSDAYLRRMTRDEGHLDIVRTLGFESFMCVPLKDGDDVVGTLTLVSAGSGRRFQAADLTLPEELAARAANVVASARRHEREHRLAFELQRLLLPEQLPEIPGFEVCVRYSAGAPHADAGGDFYDLVHLDNRRVALVIGDVEGHDTVAAATMGQLRSATRALAGQQPEPSRLIDAIRQSWELLGFERLATMLIAVLDPSTGELVMASAGHPPPAYLEVAGASRYLEVVPSPPLGALGAPANGRSFIMDAHGILLLYTDGLVEDRTSDVQDRLDTLLGVVSDCRSLDLEDVCEHVLKMMVPSLEGQVDDIALLALRRQG
jgi:serine phosphatase RsbU (regulator of sigma subunit)